MGRSDSREGRVSDHAMLKEIFAQPDALRRTLELYTASGVLNADMADRLGRWSIPQGEVLIAASGSSRHSGLAGEILLEDLCGLAVDVEYASEYSVRGGRELRHPSCLVISQSGETSDTLAAMHAAGARGQKTLAITNDPNSTMAREADVSMPLGAGRELAIPATMSFTCQLAALYVLALFEGERREVMEPGELSFHIAGLWAQCDRIEAQLKEWREQAAELAQKYSSAASFLYLGRGIHYAIAREGALKLKEASYIPAEAYPAGELKHGPNALLSERVPLVVLATVDRQMPASVERYEKTLQLLEDMKVQGARVIALANRGDTGVSQLAADCIEVDNATEYLLPISEVVPLQLFAYFMALQRGVDVDRPRNLSKAVIEN